MIRTTVYLDEDIIAALRFRAGLENRSEQEIIRGALLRYVANGPTTERPPIRGLGAYRSGRRDVSERAEDLLRGRFR